jgi:hypothetical protein
MRSGWNAIDCERSVGIGYGEVWLIQHDDPRARHRTALHREFEDAGRAEQLVVRDHLPVIRKWRNSNSVPRCYVGRAGALGERVVIHDIESSARNRRLNLRAPCAIIVGELEPSVARKGPPLTYIGQPHHGVRDLSASTGEKLHHEGLGAPILIRRNDNGRVTWRDSIEVDGSGDPAGIRDRRNGIRHGGSAKDDRATSGANCVSQCLGGALVSAGTCGDEQETDDWDRMS